VPESLKQQGGNLHMIDLGGDVTGNGISKLVFTILSAVAEAERDRIRERIADVKHDQKTRGRFLGGSRPFGWQIAADGSLEPLESERKALLAMHRLQKAGKSLRAIAAAMQERGLPSRTKASRRRSRALATPRDPWLTSPARRQLRHASCIRTKPT
jgi:putative DNA-invertase from lambdoid prophage Rac